MEIPRGAMALTLIVGILDNFNGYPLRLEIMNLILGKCIPFAGRDIYLREMRGKK
jgi:hypothetical protein